MPELNIVGLTMTMNEEDIVEESFVRHTRLFNKILVLDNSTDRTPDILYQFPQVNKIFNQKRTFGSQQWNDGMMSVLLDYAIEHYNPDWFAICYPDEIYHDDPVKAIQMADSQGKECIWWKTAQFYLHESEVDTTLIEDITKPVQDRRLWYSVNWAELRQFKNIPGIHYQIGRHGYIEPDGINPKNRMEATPLNKHYSFRNINQSINRIKERSAIQPWYLKSAGKKLFKTHCPHGLPLKRYDGSFGIYENSLEPEGIRGNGWNYITQEDFNRGSKLQMTGVR